MSQILISGTDTLYPSYQHSLDLQHILWPRRGGYENLFSGKVGCTRDGLTLKICQDKNDSSRPRHLSVDIKQIFSLFQIDLHSPHFNGLTHLDIRRDVWSLRADRTALESLREMRCLTHLALIMEQAAFLPNSINKLISCFPVPLQVCVVDCQGRLPIFDYGTQARILSEIDYRMVLCCSLPSRSDVGEGDRTRGRTPSPLARPCGGRTRG